MPRRGRLLDERLYPVFAKARVEDAVIGGSHVKASILLDPPTSVVFLNRTAAETLRLLARHTPREAAALLAEEYGASPSLVEGDVEAFAAAGLREGFLSREPPRRPAPVEQLAGDREPVEGRLAYPADVDLEVTGRCNMRCLHCYSRASPLGPPGPGMGEVEALAGELGGEGAMRVLVGGGEPLLRDDVVEVVKAFTGAGVAVNMSSNGFFFTESLGAELYAAGLRVIQFSVDGLADTHDRLRGVRGAFERVTRAIVEAKRLGMYVMVKTVAMRPNLWEIPRLVPLLCRLGVDAYYFNRPLPAGRAGDNWAAIGLSYREYERVIGEARAALPRGCEMRLGYEERRPGAARLPLGSRGTCSAGITYVALDSALRVKPCAFFPEAYTCGRLYAEWGSLREAWEKCPLFKELRGLGVESLGEPCRTCRRCGGGCRAAALLVYGSLYAPDPMCPVVEGGLGAGG